MSDEIEDDGRDDWHQEIPDMPGPLDEDPRCSGAMMRDGVEYLRWDTVWMERSQLEELLTDEINELADQVFIDPVANLTNSDLAFIVGWIEGAHPAAFVDAMAALNRASRKPPPVLRNPP